MKKVIKKLESKNYRKTNDKYKICLYCIHSVDYNTENGNIVCNNFYKNSMVDVCDDYKE